MPKGGLKWRTYQLEAISAAIRYYYTGKRRTLIALPTGAGKTVVAGGAIERLLNAVGHVLFVVPRTDLVEQTYEEYAQFFFSESQLGMIQGDEHNDLGRQITIACKDTIDNEDRLQAYLDSIGGSVGMLIFDEAQYTLTELYEMLVNRCLREGGFLLGLSATPIRADNQSLAPMYPDRVCYFKDTMELVYEGSLCNFRDEIINVDVELEKKVPVGTRNRAKVIELIRKHTRYQLAYDAWYRLGCHQKRTLVFAQNLEDARGFEAFFKSKGVDCVVVTGMTKNRKEIYDRFRSGELKMIINFNVMTTGNNIKEIECILLARPTNNIGLWMQIIGRGLRLAPHIGKTFCQIINITGREYNMITFYDLFGSVADPTLSARENMEMIYERVRKQREEEQEGVDLSSVDIGIKLGQITAREHNPFIGDNWQRDPVVGNVTREWIYKGERHQLVCEQSLFSEEFYLPVHIDHRNHRHVLSKNEYMPLIRAQRTCHQHATMRELNFEKTQERKKPEHWNDPITEQQLDYLLQRKVSVKPSGWKKGDKARDLTPEERAEILEHMTMGEYHKINFHLSKNGSKFSPTNGLVSYQVGPGVKFSNARGRILAEQEMKRMQGLPAPDVQVTITSRR